MPLTLATDVVLLELVITCVGGFDVARQLRGDPRYDARRLIALTDRERTAASGFDGHLTRPADIADLHALLMAMPRRNEP